MQNDCRLAAAGYAVQNHIDLQRLTDNLILLLLNGRNNFLKPAAAVAGQHHLQHIVLDIDFGIEQALQLSVFYNVLPAACQLNLHRTGRSLVHHRAQPLLIKQRGRRSPPVQDQGLTIHRQAIPADIMLAVLSFLLIMKCNLSKIRIIIHSAQLIDPLIGRGILLLANRILCIHQIMLILRNFLK